MKIQPIKMIATDLDGTLLREDKTVSELSKKVLKRCKENGIKIVYATGRCINSTQVVPFELFDGYIVNNGAVAYAGNEIIYKKQIHHEMIRPLLLACDKLGIKAASQLEDVDYSNFDVVNEWSEYTKFEIVDFSKHEKPTEKMYAIIRNAEDIELIESNLHDDLYLSISRENFAMVMHKDATKSKAVKALSELWGITQSEIVAFGDDANDIDLLLYAGIGIAMDNSIDEVKAVADQICLSNEEDGLAIWIDENIFPSRNESIK